MGLVAGYGPCACGAEYEVQRVNVLDDDGSVRLGGIPKGDCPNCRGDVYKAVVVALLDALLSGRPVPMPPEPL